MDIGRVNVITPLYHSYRSLSMAFVIKPGDIIIVNNRGNSFFSKAIRFFTSVPWSHTALGFFDVPRNPFRVQTIFEANLTTGVTDWDKTYNDMSIDLRIYRWKVKVDSAPILWRLFNKYNGNAYGFFQIVWFMWRWVVEKVHLPTRWARKNFFNDREICTEVVYVFFKELNDINVNAVLQKLNRDQNTVHPGDILFICEELRKLDVLELVYNR
jgi:hypothetical protein